MKKSLSKINHFFPLSYAQKRIWVLNHLESGNLSYNIGLLSEIDGQLDLGVMSQVLKEMMRRHDILRTVFRTNPDGQPEQCIIPGLTNQIHFFDVSRQRSPQSAARKLIKANVDYRFSLENESLLRLGVIKIGPKKNKIFLVMHHLISDIWSLMLFSNEFFKRYEEISNSQAARVFATPPTMRYQDYALWEQSADFLPAILSQEKYWLKQLGGELPVLDLPSDNPRPLMQQYDTKSVITTVDREITGEIIKFCGENNVTTYAFLMAIFNVLLYKLSQQPDLLVGTFAAKRDLPELDNVLGLFLNNLTIRSEIKREESFSSYLGRLQETILQAMENKDYPFEKLIEKLNPPRDLSRAPIFNVVFQMFNNDARLKTNFFNNYTRRDYVFDYGQSQFDLICKAFIGEQKISLVFSYNTALFRRDTIKNWQKYFIKILREVLQAPENALNCFEILSSSEKKKLNNFNKTTLNLPANQTIIDLLEKQVKKTPQAIALVFAAHEISYQEFNQEVNRRARYLLDLGVKPSMVVAIAWPRDEELLYNLWAILKIGATYLPLDHEQPQSRQEYILSKSQTDFIICHDKKSFSSAYRTIQFEKSKLEKFSPINFSHKIKLDQLAYLMFTSGSTGEPKGVKISHRALLNFVLGIPKQIDLKNNNTVLATTNLSFDIFFLEALAPLCWGKKIVLTSEEERLSPENLKSLIVEQQTEIVQFTPSYLKLLLDQDKKVSWLKNVNVMLLGGETLSDNLLHFLQKKFTGKIYNLYGPTETTIWSSVADLTKSKNVHLGKPLANTEIYVLDAEQQLCPIGVKGEIYISGQGLATGYLDKDETEKSFVPHPFFSGKKIYRTGDSAYWSRTGELKYCGRLDNQIKLSGRRLEPAEIEKAMNAIAGVEESVVLKRTEKIEFLVAYYSGPAEINAASLRAELKKSLSLGIIPSYFVYLKKFPLNRNGKIARSALPMPNWQENLKDLKHFVNDSLEEKILHIWQDVLGKKNIGREENFFSLGGQSLHLIQVFNRLEKEFPGKIKIAELFSHPTLASLAELLRAEKLSLPKTVTINYQRRASRLIDRVSQGKISAAEAAKIFDKI